MAGRQDKHGEEVVERRSAGGSVVLIAAADLVDALVERGLLSDLPLAELASAQPSEFSGRGRPVVFELPGGRAIAKRMLHGGLLGPLLRDRFLGAARVRDLVALHAVLAERGIATPRFAFARVRKGAAGTCRLDVATRELLGASDGLAFLRSRPPPAVRRAAVRAAAEAIRALHDAGVEHADLNVKNILLQQQGTAVAAYVIDLEKSRRVERLPRAAAVGNLERLARSAEKLGLLGDALSRADVVRFAKCYGGADWRSWFTAARRRRRALAPFHRLFWNVTGRDGDRGSSAK